MVYIFFIHSFEELDSKSMFLIFFSCIKESKDTKKYEETVIRRKNIENIINENIAEIRHRNKVIKNMKKKGELCW